MEALDLSPIPSPFVVLVDTREQFPFEFEQVRADYDERYRAVHVRTEVRGLKSGDYSLMADDGTDYSSRVAIERKSHSDLFSSIGRERERFERELARLNELDFAAVVCEGSWREIAYHPPEFSGMSCKAVMRSIFAFSVRYPRVHWFPMGCRSMAEVTTYRLLERFWRDEQKRLVGKEAA